MLWRWMLRHTLLLISVFILKFIRVVFFLYLQVSVRLMLFSFLRQIVLRMCHLSFLLCHKHFVYYRCSFGGQRCRLFFSFMLDTKFHVHSVQRRRMEYCQLKVFKSQNSWKRRPFKSWYWNYNNEIVIRFLSISYTINAV